MFLVRKIRMIIYLLYYVLLRINLRNAVSNMMQQIGCDVLQN